MSSWVDKSANSRGATNHLLLLTAHYLLVSVHGEAMRGDEVNGESLLTDTHYYLLVSVHGEAVRGDEVDGEARPHAAGTSPPLL